MRYLFRAKDVRVIDGDTIACNLDRGLDGTITPVHLRLRRVFAPERKQEGYASSAQNLNFLIARFGGGGWPLVVETFKTPISDQTVETLSRYVAELYSPDEEVNINNEQIFWLKQQGYPTGTGGS